MSEDETKALREMLARIDTRLDAVERALTTEHDSASSRGRDQARIGERVARLEATIEYILEALRALPAKAGASATAGVGALATIIWILTGGTP
jgi:ParB-like chromosome segregation protein Spo0J